MSADRLRVLVLADSANPESSSVSLIGWSLTQALAKHVDVHLVTKPQNAPAMERAGWREGRDFTTIDPSRVERPVSAMGEAVRKGTGLGWTFTTALASLPYAYFERLVWRAFGQAIQEGAYDVVHRVVPVSPTIPSSMASLCHAAGVPFVLGPINGGVPWPKEFRHALRREGEWLTYLRAAHRLVPGHGATRRLSSAILAGSTHVWGEMEGFHDRCVYMPENAIDPSRMAAERRPRSPGPLCVAFVGRLVPYKGADMLLEAAAPLIREGKLKLDLIGDGPEMPNLRRQLVQEGIEEGVTMAGWIHDQRAIAPRLARSDVFGFPSVREFGGGAVLEAMALGLAPVIVDYAGPSELVTESTGFRVPIGPRDFVVREFRRIFEELAANPGLAREVGERARERVNRHFTWDVKARQIADVYRWVVGKGERPNFGMPFPDEPIAASEVGARDVG